MKFRLAFFAVALLSGTFANAQPWQGVNLDPQGLIRPQLLSLALQAFAAHDDTKLSRSDIAIVDFAKPSSERRLYLVNLQSGVVNAYLVAHGRGSDRNHDAMADAFSDVSGSHASSLGAYRADVRYQGTHGLSLRLDGLDPTNRSARARAVVLHSQWYVSDRMLAEHGKLGRSLGCFVVDPAVVGALVQHLENGGFIFASR